MTTHDSTTETEQPINIIPPWMDISVDKAVSILEDMTSGQLIAFDLRRFAYEPEEALVLISAMQVVMLAFADGGITVSEDARWAMGMISSKQRWLEAQHAVIRSYIYDALDKEQDNPVVDEIGAIKDVPADYMSGYELELLQLKRRKRWSPPVPGYVYVLRSPTGAYKIGLTKTPADRLRTFSVKLPFEVEYEMLFKTIDMRGLEATLHAHFADKHINGEWFALTADDLAELRKMGGAS